MNNSKTDLNHKLSTISLKSGKNVKFLIVGGGFKNKGAEAMLFTLITELRNRYNNCEIFVELKQDTIKKTIEDTYDVNFFKYSKKERNHLVKLPLRLFDKFNKKEGSKLSKILKLVDVIFDISGYSLSSQWNIKQSKGALQIVELAKLFNKRLIFMPQSFGPFDYKPKYKLPPSYIKKCLSYADLVFCRETQGYDLLSSLGLDNIVLSNDMVIQSNKPYNNVFKKEIFAENIDIKNKSVLIIPNKRVYERIDNDTYMNFYKTSINHLLEKNYNIYLTWYDLSDKEICERINNLYKNEKNVNYFKDSLNYKTFENVLPKFDFIIASRYHSIVHSYKQYVPAIVFSWAVKYKELLKSVKQENFNFDCKTEIDLQKLKSKIDYLIENHEEERKIIEECVKTIQKTNCFDKIWSVLDKNNIEAVVENNLCISCGMCYASCPVNCISSAFNGINLEMKIDKDKCVNCGKCLKVCSIKEVQKYDESIDIEDYLLGHYDSILRAKTKNIELLKNSTSGGAVSQIVKTLIDKDIYKSAFLVEGYNYKSHLKTKRFVKGDDLRETAKSRYLTVSHEDTVNYIKNNPDERLIIVGTPCVISSFRNFIEMSGLDRKNYLLLGLFCDKTMNYNVVNYFSQHKASKGKIINKLYFRTKDNCGWPGDMELVYEDSSHIFLPSKERMKVKTYFVPERCLYCLDKLNKNADISFGDNYISDNSDKLGMSSVIIRTSQGQDCWSKVQDLFEYDFDERVALTNSQGLKKKISNIQFAKFKKLLIGLPDKNYKSKYEQAFKMIQIGLSDKNLCKKVQFDIKFKKILSKVLKIKF